MVFTWVGLTCVSFWLYYFGYNMNIIPSNFNCWYVVQEEISTGVVTEILSTTNNTYTPHGDYKQLDSTNVTYNFRLICVLGVTCFSLLGFISCAQVLKPLYVLIAMVVPYVFAAFIWWYIYSYNNIYSEAGKACSNYETLSNSVTQSGAPVFNSTEVSMLWIQGQTMTRWFVAFSVIAVVFLLFCLPFSTYFTVKKVQSDCEKAARDKARRERYDRNRQKLNQYKEARRKQQELKENGGIDIPCDDEVEIEVK